MVAIIHSLTTQTTSENKMKYTVSGLVTVSCHTVVEAESAEEAMEIAERRDVASLCYGPYVEDIDEAFHISTDGEARELCVEGYEDYEE